MLCATMGFHFIDIALFSRVEEESNQEENSEESYEEEGEESQGSEEDM